MAINGSSAATAATKSISVCGNGFVDEDPGDVGVVVAEPAHRPRGESSADEIAEAGVVGWVDLEHHPRQLHVGALA